MKIIHGDCLEELKKLPSESVDCVVTSPPYWALRDYGVYGQLGLEKTFQEYITKLCDIFDEVKRVLKKEGTCWVNLGDTYAGSGNGKGSIDPKNKKARDGHFKQESQIIPDKSLCCIPDRFKIEMIDRGWICRNEIIWWKPNCMPSSVKDRFTVDYEKVFLFVKQQKYFFKTQYEPMAENSDAKYRARIRINKQYNTKQPYKNNTPYASNKISKDVRINSTENANRAFGDNESLERMLDKGRNKRCVWKVPTKPFKECHFATYPEKLIEPMIDAGCPVDGTVLDPFFGAGTTGVVAKKQNKNYIGIEINKEYIKIAQKRIDSIPNPLL